MNDTKTDAGTTAIDICVQHAREILDSQLPKIKDKGYDFAPQFRQMTIQLYLAGVMWRRGESLGLSTNARDHAFAALQSMLISDGMRKKQAQQRIAFLNNMSRVEDGGDTHALTIGYEAEPMTIAWPWSLMSIKMRYGFRAHCGAFMSVVKKSCLSVVRQQPL